MRIVFYARILPINNFALFGKFCYIGITASKSSSRLWMIYESIRTNEILFLRFIQHVRVLVLEGKNF